MNRYNSYKDSGEEWIGEIPITWEVGKLGFFSSVYRGSGYQFLQQVDEDSSETKEKVVRIGDFNDFKPIWCKYLEQFENYRIKKGNLLIGGTGHYFGKNMFVSDEMEGLIHSYNIIRLVVNNQDSKYVSYWLQSNLIREQMDISVLGSGQPFIDLQGVKDLKLLIPPLPEQQQIVSFLDDKTQKIDSLIQHKEKKIELLKEKRTSLINHVVTKGLDSNVEMKDSGVEWIGEIPNHWGIPKLSYLLEGITDGTHGTHERVDEGELFLSSKNVTNKGLSIGKNESQITTEEHEKIVKKGYPVKGDILITVVGSIGRSCVYEYDYPISFQRSVCFLRLRKTVNEYFMNFLINSDVIQFQLLKNTKKSTQGGIYMNDLKRFDTILPPISEQQQIVEYLDKHTEEIDTLIQLEQKKIDILKEYRQSLISEVVTGKLRVV
tara:strand:+ start:145 stop:1446 length:1302 start_codon:yes stop_codon:yes gene_type:complete